jgi:hypothetical protein
MIEGARREARRWVQEISDHDRRPRLEPVQYHVIAGEPDEVALHFQANNAGMRHASGKTQHRSARSASDIEDELMRFRWNRGSEENRVDRYPIPDRPLFQADAAAK